jgi:hypothetical protein
VLLEVGLTTEHTEKWSLESQGNFRGRGSGVLSCELFFLFFPWLIASLFVDSERVLLLTGYGTLWCLFGSPDLPFSW